jgi:hypothetical protein
MQVCMGQIVLELRKLFLIYSAFARSLDSARRTVILVVHAHQPGE